jgi:hypothetical protein
MRTQRKGAFQVSMGFIIAVVFAVVLLSLALSWLSGFMGQIGDVTHKVTEVARTELINKIAQTGATVGIAAPPVTSWNRGETGSFAVGIKNKFTDQSKTFSINVYLEQLGGNLAGTSASSKAQEVSNWMTYSFTEFVEAGGSATSDLILKPAANADSGIYKFRVLICESQPCTTLEATPENNIYGTESFAIEIEAF